MTAPTPSSPARAALALGALGLVTPAFALTTSSNNNFVLVQDLALVVFPLLGLVAVVGGLTRRRAVIAAAGAAYAAAAVLQLLQLGRATNWLDGNGSTFALLLALAAGLLVTATLSDESTPHPQPDANRGPRTWT